MVYIFQFFYSKQAHVLNCKNNSKIIIICCKYNIITDYIKILKRYWRVNKRIVFIEVNSQIQVWYLFIGTYKEVTRHLKYPELEECERPKV